MVHLIHHDVCFIRHDVCTHTKSRIKFFFFCIWRLTAFDEHALTPFELAAVDYVLRPCARTRLACTLRLGRQRLRQVNPED